MSARVGMERDIVNTSFLQKMWNSMRIMKRFTIPDILRTVPGETEDNANFYFYQLEETGVIGKIGNYIPGRVGEYQGYVLLKDIGHATQWLANGSSECIPDATKQLATTPSAIKKKTVNNKSKYENKKLIMEKLSVLDRQTALDLIIEALTLTLARPGEIGSDSEKEYQFINKWLEHVRPLKYRSIYFLKNGFEVLF